MITSLNNGRIRHAIQLKEKSRTRNEEGLFVAEGFKMFEEAPLSKIREIYCREDVWQRMEESYRKAPPDKLSGIYEKLMTCQKQGTVVETVTEEVFRKLSDTQTPQGIFFLMEKMTYDLSDLLRGAGERKAQEGKRPLFLILEDIQDPGNLGTMIRTGEGAGVDGILMSKGTVDIYNPKTIRATMGSLYRMPFVYVDDFCETIRMAKAQGIRLYAAHLKGKHTYDGEDYRKPSGFLIGNEGNGLTEEAADSATDYIRIPMGGQLESLNAAIAAAVLMYEAQRQRRNIER